MATCAVSGQEIMTHYYVRVEPVGADNKRSGDPIFLSLDISYDQAIEYLNEQLIMGEDKLYRFLYSPMAFPSVNPVTGANIQPVKEQFVTRVKVVGNTQIDTGIVWTEGYVESREDIAAALAKIPFGGAVPKPYMTTEENAIYNANLAGQKPQPKRISEL